MYGVFLCFFCKGKSCFSIQKKKKEETDELAQKFAWLPGMRFWRMFAALQTWQRNCECWQHGNYWWELCSKLRSIKTNGKKKKRSDWKKSKENLRFSEGQAAKMPFVLQSSPEILKHKFRIGLMSLRLNKKTYTHLITRYGQIMTNNTLILAKRKE